MPRYIDADALLEEQGNLVCAGLRNGKTILLACKNYLKAVIDHAPTADVAPVRHGKWTMQRTGMHDGEWYCSACDYEPVVFTGSDYCPNCGAKMVLED